MESLVVYATRSGNTRRIAEVVAEGLRPHGPVHIRSVEESMNGPVPAADLLVIGGPTEGHGATESMIAFLDHLATAPPSGAVAAFDTRVRWPKVLSGSAAERIEQRIEAIGLRLVVPPESFIVSMKPELQPGELERAGAWRADLGRRVVAARVSAPVAV